MMKSARYVRKSGRRVIIRPVNSTGLLYFQIVTHLLAIVLVTCTSLSFFTQAAIVFLVIIHMSMSIRSTGNRHLLSLAMGKDLLLKSGDSNWRTIRILESFVTEWLIVIKVIEQDGKTPRSLVYARDSISPAQFRLLRKFINLHARSDSEFS